MRAVLCRALGDPTKPRSEGGALAVEDVPSPRCPADGVKVRVDAASLNFADVLMVQGSYQEKPRMPFIPGGECAGVVTESKTGIAFPAQVLSPTSGRALSLAGAGVRVKFWVVNVYAVGLYFDAAKLKGQSTSELPPVADVPALVRITLAMELPREKYNDAIKEQVEPRMASATADFEAFVNLSNQLPPTLAKGMAIDLHLDSGTLSLVADEQRVGTVVSSALCNALADVYMGSDPVSPTAKQAAIQGLPLI